MNKKKRKMTTKRKSNKNHKKSEMEMASVSKMERVRNTLNNCSLIPKMTFMV